MIYAFIDSQNLYIGIKNQRWILDYQKFFVYLREKYKFKKAFIYIGFLKENIPLYRQLSGAGFEIVFKNTKQFGKGIDQIKGNIDVDLTVDAIRKSKEYDKGVFVSADGDFVALYDYLVDDLRFMNDLGDKLGKQ